MYSGDTFALRIGIEQSPTVRERYRLQFLNSYGTYEVFSLEGEASVTPSMDEDEDAVSGVTMKLPMIIIRIAYGRRYRKL